jgi:hypothetical protein
VSYSMIPLVVTIEALALLLSWTALAARRLPRPVRPLIALLGHSGAWGVWALILVLRGPGWMAGLAAMVMVVSGAVMAITIHLVTREEEDGGGGGDTGGGPGPEPEAPRDGGGDTEPPWWPEFERELADYAAQRERDRRRQPVEC